MLQDNQDTPREEIKPYFESNGIIIYHGNCEDILRQLPSNSIDSSVCDPPYGIKFMSKKWDYSIPKVSIWEEVLRTLKPGAHLTSLAGTRTHHRMVVNIEDAGFQIRDMICELVDTNPYFEEFVSTLTQEQLKVFAKFASVDALLGWGQGQGFPKSQDIGKSIDKHFRAKREVTDSYKVDDMRGGNFIRGGYKRISVNTTSPSTPEAKQWDGWGTALKPALEPITLARKPISEKTIAANVLRWGVGAISIDGCRIPRGDISGFPSNVILDDSKHVEDLFPNTKNGGQNATSRTGKMRKGVTFKMREAGPPSNFVGDFGSASRYFYTAKASKSERGEGNNHPTVKPIALMRYLVRLITPPGGIVLDPFAGSFTTGIAAIREGFDFIGIEQDERYCEIGVKRLLEELQRMGK